MKLSAMQEVVVNSLISTKDNLIVTARAGSGKTTLLGACAHAVAKANLGSAIFLAFNKSIADELTSRLPATAPAKTFHSLGFSELRQRRRGIKAEPKKVMQILKTLAPDLLYEDHAVIARLVSLCKNSGCGVLIRDDIATISKLADDADFGDTENIDLSRVIMLAHSALRESNADTSIIDFDDMIYLPILQNLSLTKYDLVFVDEAQDISPLQRHFIKKIARRVVVVGDDMQAIYAFRGADCHSMSQFKADFACVSLPLSITYRCPKKVVELARENCPDFEASPDAIDGEINYTDEAKFDLLSIPTGAMLLCRNNKPLFHLVMRYLRMRKPFNIASDFTSDLKRFIKGRKATSLKQLETRLNSWASKEIDKAEKAENFRKVEQIQDKRDVLIDLISECLMEGKNTISDLCALLDKIADSTGGVSLSTIHKAKGLENEDVYLLHPELLPSKFATSDTELQQERNLYYVAITRSKKNLTFISARKE